MQFRTHSQAVPPSFRVGLSTSINLRQSLTGMPTDQPNLDKTSQSLLSQAILDLIRLRIDIDRHAVCPWFIIMLSLIYNVVDLTMVPKYSVEIVL